MSSKKKWLAGSVVLNIVLIGGLVLFFSVSGASGGRVSSDAKPPTKSENPKLKKKVRELYERYDNTAILVVRKGQIRVLSVQGDPVKPCTIQPGPEQCEAFKKGVKVQAMGLSSVNIFDYQVNPNCTLTCFGGSCYPICW